MPGNIAETQIYASITKTAKAHDVSRGFIYSLNRRYHFIYKLGSRSLVNLVEFNEALKKELKPLV